MKAILPTESKLIVVLLLMHGSLLYAQSTPETKQTPHYTTISGVVKDQITRDPLQYVNISVVGTSIGTITNVDGAFILKVADEISSRRIEISSLGYQSRVVNFGNHDVEDAQIYLSPQPNLLPEVVVRAIDPLKLIKEAVGKIALNYSPTPNLLTGFYRETVRKRRTYIDVTEAIVNLYKTPYDKADIEQDRVRVYKGRRLVSPKLSDTLAIKLQGGPMLSIYSDAVKNHDMLFGEESIKDYKFTMDTPVMLDKRPHYVVNVEPAVSQPYPLYYGQIFIDQNSLTFTQVSLYYSMKDRNKITALILRKKPFNLRFRPQEINWLINYRTENGVTYLNYVRNEIQFKCDWKRRLFSTNYAVVSEMVITDKTLHDVASIPWKEAFRDRTILSDKVQSFYDKDFWEGYNIIAPSESLQSAVNKLRKKYE